MLRILQGETKFWYLTLTEKTTISNPTYLFSITHRLTNTTTNFILTDISTYVDRYNKFEVTEGTTFSVDSGEFLYRVYAQTSPSNLNPNLADELVEQGLLKVNDVFVSKTQYTPNLIEKIYE
jgi:regulator of RNase E activity RraB